MLYEMSELVLTAPATRRQRARRAELIEGGVRFDLDGGPVVVAGHLDGRGAGRTCGLASRILSVELTVGAEPSAEVVAVWHRSPCARPISIGAALALALAGVPAYLAGELP